MIRKFAYAAAATAAWLAAIGPSLAPAHAEVQAGGVVAAPGEQGTIMHVTVIVEGEEIATRQTVDAEGRTLIDARPVIEALRGQITTEESFLIIRRYQDGARMSIDFSDGKVRAGKAVLGKLPDWTPQETPDTWLEANAISVLTGCHIGESEDGRLTLTLDDRLRPQFDLDLFVEGERLAFLAEEPRTIGSILLVPLRPVAEALGHEVSEDRAAGTVTVTRVQDSAVFTLNLATGLVSVNGEPRGVTPNISYAEPATLLLPFSAIETLTGTHVVLKPGSDRIDISLDDRLATGALPGARVDDEAAETPFTPERLDFALSNRGTNTAALHARLRGFTSVTRYETVGGFGSPEELQPRWMSVDIESLKGWQGSVGDATPRLGELTGVNVSRIRGVTWRKRTQSDTIIAIAAGVPLAGATQINERAARPDFAGAAVGVRHINPDKRREIGLAVSGGRDGETSRVVASVRQEIITYADETLKAGLAGVFASADLGVFETGADLRGQVDAHYRLSQASSLRASLSHEGARFSERRVETETTPQAEDETGAEVGLVDPLTAAAIATETTTREGISRTRAHLSVDWRSRTPWGVLHNPAAGARTQVSQTGDATTQGISLSASGRLGENGADLSLDIGHSTSSGNGRESALSVVNLRGHQRFDWGQVQATFNSTHGDGTTRQQVVATVNGRPVRRPLGKGAWLTLAPSATAIADESGQFARFGGVASIDAGEALGERIGLRAQMSALQSVDPERARTDFFGSVNAHYDIFRNIRLEAAYFDNFRDSRSLSLGLRGSVVFNPPRKHNLPLEGRGVLKGRVFFDRNRDGIRQDDEPGIPGVRVGVRNTRLSLQVDRNGFYTIQNMKTGLFSLWVDRRSLPLGMLVREDAALRATIGEGRITQLDIPVIASGQIRGTVFVDTNGDSRPGPGETRLEGAWLKLESLDRPDAEPLEQAAASFGQYAFDGLSPGRYRLSVRHGGRLLEHELELVEDELFMVRDLPVDAPAEPPQDGPAEPDEGAIEFVA